MPTIDDLDLQLKNMSPQKKAEIAAQIQAELQRREQGLSVDPGMEVQPTFSERLQAGGLAGLKALPYIVRNKVPPQSVPMTEMQKLQAQQKMEMEKEQWKRTLPPTALEQAKIDALNAKKGLSVEDKISLLEAKSENDKEMAELKHQLALGDPTVQPKLDILQKQKELLDLKIKVAEESGLTPAQKIKQKETETAKEKESDLIKSEAQDTLNTIVEVKKGINFFGRYGEMKTPFFYPGKKGYEERTAWESSVDKLLAKKMVDLIMRMKSATRTGATGFGPLSDKEGEILRSASTALRKNLTPAKAEYHINQMIPLLEKIVNGGETNGNSEQGQVMIDAQGNKAIVYPDGTYKEMP